MLKDVFSKWFEAIPLHNTTSQQVLRALQMLYEQYGHPLQVHTDNAMYFQSQMMQEAFRRTGVRLTFTPTYNASVELGGMGAQRPEHHALCSLPPTCS